MQKLLNRITCRVYAALCALLVACSPVLVWAQQVEVPPSPKLVRTPAVWVGYLLIGVLLVIVMAVSLMPSKRSHQD